jgi:hypothetical protein
MKGDSLFSKHTAENNKSALASNNHTEIHDSALGIASLKIRLAKIRLQGCLILGHLDCLIIANSIVFVGFIW